MFWNKKKKEAPKSLTITDANFKEKIVDSDEAILLDFWAPWCGPCKALGPIIDELAEEFEGKAIVGKINVDQNPGLSGHFKVKSIPTLVFIKKAQLIERFQGMVPKPNLEEMLNELIALDVKRVNKIEEKE